MEFVDEDDDDIDDDEEEESVLQRFLLGRLVSSSWSKYEFPCYSENINNFKY